MGWGAVFVAVVEAAEEGALVLEIRGESRRELVERSRIVAVVADALAVVRAVGKGTGLVELDAGVVVRDLEVVCYVVLEVESRTAGMEVVADAVQAVEQTVADAEAVDVDSLEVDCRDVQIRLVGTVLDAVDIAAAELELLDNFDAAADSTPADRPDSEPATAAADNSGQAGLDIAALHTDPAPVDHASHIIAAVPVLERKGLLVAGL